MGNSKKKYEKSDNIITNDNLLKDDKIIRKGIYEIKWKQTGVAIF